MQSLRSFDMSAVQDQQMPQVGSPSADKVDTDRTIGGKNHTVRNVFYEILSYLCAGVQPVYVFDGPQKPQCKRGRYIDFEKLNARTTLDKDPAVFDRSRAHIIPLLREMLALFRLPFHQAPAEAEAECTTMERIGVVDGVITKDSDVLVLGGKLILWPVSKKPNGMKAARARAKVYRPADLIQSGQPLITEDLALFALLTGTDYHHGIYSCGGGTAMRVVREGFGLRLPGVMQAQDTSIASWKEELCKMLRTGPPSGEQMAPKIADHIEQMKGGFPDNRVWHLYTKLSVSSLEDLQNKSRTWWAAAANTYGLYAFAKKHFEWLGESYARKFIDVTYVGLASQAMMLEGDGMPNVPAERLHLRALKTRADSKDEPSAICVELIPEKVVPNNWRAQTGLSRNSFKAVVDKLCKEWIPEWLARYARIDLSSSCKNGNPTFLDTFSPVRSKKQKKSGSKFEILASAVTAQVSTADLVSTPQNSTVRQGRSREQDLGSDLSRTSENMSYKTDANDIRPRSSPLRAKDVSANHSAEHHDADFEDIDDTLGTPDILEQYRIKKQVSDAHSAPLDAMDPSAPVAASYTIRATVHTQGRARPPALMPNAQPKLVKRKRANDDYYEPQVELPRLLVLPSTLIPVDGQTAATAIVLSSET